MSRSHCNRSVAARLLTVVKGAFTPCERPLAIFDVLAEPPSTATAASALAGLVPAPRRPQVGPRACSPRIIT